MKLVSKSRILGLVIFVIPLLTINSILLFSQSFQFKYEPVPGNYYKDIKIYDAGKALRDKQDVLAMCSLQYAAQLELSKNQPISNQNDTEDKLQELIDMIDVHLAAY